jgi:hypothetical protein
VLRFPSLVLKDRSPDMVLAVRVQGLDFGDQILAAMRFRWQNQNAVQGSGNVRYVSTSMGVVRLVGTPSKAVASYISRNLARSVCRSPPFAKISLASSWT